MSSQIRNSLKSMGLAPEMPASFSTRYLPIRGHVDTVYISGQLPLNKAGSLQYAGRVPSQISLEDAKKAARISAMNILLHLLSMLNDNEELIECCVRLEVFVNTDQDFTRHSEVGDAASDLIVSLLGDKGRHSRIAVGVSSLPQNSPVEISAIFAIHSRDH